MPEILKVIILGIIEGLTEFLPISSTGHLIVATALLHFSGTLGGTFEIFIQLGAVVAVMVYFFGEFVQQLRSIRRDPQVRRLWTALVIAFLPAGVIGVLFGETIKAALFNPVVVAITLILGGIVFIVEERAHIAERASTHREGDITPKQALVVGLAQTIALIPGISRSGASIVGGMFVGLDRTLATKFSFFLAVLTLGPATLYDLLKNLDHIQSNDMLNLGVGALVSGIVAWFSIRWLLRYVATNSFTAFGYYRIIAGLLILVLAAAGTFTA